MEPHSSGRKVAYAGFALAGLGLALYAGALRFDFVSYDDRTVLLSHPELYGGPSLLENLRQILVAAFPREEPLLVRDLSWVIDSRLFGFANPLGYHLGNVLLNAANGVLFFLFLLRGTRRFDLALAAAAGFVVLPVHVESVAWVMGRKDLLSGFFVLTALLAQTFELEERSQARRRLFYAVGLLATLLALLSKIAAMSCVGLLALHRLFEPHLSGRRLPEAPIEWGTALRTLPPLLPHALATAAIVAWYQHVLTQYGVLGWRGHGPLDPTHLANVAAFTPLVIGHYLRSIVWPTQLSALYRWPHVEIPLTGLERLGAGAITGALLFAAIYCGLRRRDLAFHLLGFLVLLVPYANLAFVDIWCADRYVYQAAGCVLAIAASLLVPLYTSARPPLRGVAVALAAIFALGSAAATLRQEAVWQNDDTFWSYEAHLAEPSLQAIQALATLYVERAEKASDPGRRDELVEAARREIDRGFARDRALGRRPSGYATSETLQLSRLYLLKGRLSALDGAPVERQLEAYQKADEVAPSRASALMLARGYLELAQAASEADRERLVRTSLQHFLDYAALAGRDPVQRQRIDSMLAGIYERPYPYLRDEILTARRQRLQ